MPLDLGSVTTAQTIYVRLDNNNKVQFSLDNENFYDPPINWTPPKTNTDALPITFILPSGVTGITSSNTNITMKSVAVTVNMAQTETKDPFWVHKKGTSEDPNESKGTSEDPRIVVTPQ